MVINSADISCLRSNCFFHSVNIYIIQFYESCSVNNAETPELKASRLTMCTVSAGTIRLLMSLLGIPVVEKL
jgi:hypothetical protein